jgi:hypothetical protein
MMDTIPDCLEIADSVLYQKIQDEVVLLNMDSQQYYGLNSVGADMLDNLIELKSVAAATERICERYGAESGLVQRDLNLFVRDMLNAGLLRVASPNGVLA